MPRLIRIALVCLIAFTLPAAVVQAQEPPQTYVVTANQVINARACPMVTCTILRTFDPGAELTVVAVVQGDTVADSDQWLQVEVDGSTVYVHSLLAELVPPEPTPEPTPAPTLEPTPAPTPEPAAGSPAVDTRDWVEHAAEGFALDTPPSWTDANELLSDEELLRTIAQLYGTDPEEFIQSIQMILTEMDIYLMDMGSGTSGFVWHENLGWGHASADLLKNLMVIMFVSGDATLVSAETVEMSAGEAVRLNFTQSGQLGQVTMETEILIYGVIHDDQVFYIMFTIPGVFSSEKHLANLDHIATSFRFEEITPAVLNQLPMQLGTPVLDPFTNNSNDWRYGGIVDHELVVETPELDYMRWSFASTLLEGEANYYAQVTGRITNKANHYGYGMAFRVVDADNFYYYEVDYQRLFTLYKCVEGTYETLAGPTHDSSIQRWQDGSNTLGVLIIGDYIELYLNDHQVWAGVDSSHPTGDARVVVISHEDATTAAAAAFDNYVYLPLTLAGDQTLIDEHQALIATSSTPLRVLPLTWSAQVLGSLDSGQPFAVLARSEDSQYLFGYGQGVMGWISAKGVRLERGGRSTTAITLPVLPVTVQGHAIETWPVAWPTTDPQAPTIEPIAAIVPARWL